MPPLLGAHMPTAGGLHLAIRRGVEIGCEAVQVFTSSPQQWKSKELSDEVVETFQLAMEETGVRSVISHDSYLVNLCAATEEIRDKSLAALALELQRCARLGIPFVVSHIGAHMGAGEEVGLSIAAEAVRRILAETPDSVTLLAETTAGQGTVLNSRFESLARLIEAAGEPARLGVCLDTCHVFAAGYEMRTAEGVKATLDEFDCLVGLDRLKVLHLNDSKKGLGMKLDRHEHIGKGEIGAEGFRALLADPRLTDLPATIETPDAETMHAENLATLRSLLA